MSATEALVAGRYRVIRALGAGGMGRVWLARDEVLCRDVAIKEIVLPFGLPEEKREELRLRTLREARAAARLSHPNVVQIYDVQSGDEQPWIVMEYVQSRSLLQVIEENGALPVEQVAGIGLAVLSALGAAHRVGVLHRDVKPSNVLIADDGRVVLTDFGSALIDEGDGTLTRTGAILGTPQYIAPERVDRGVSTPEADLWSLGATLYAAVEGRPPYTRPTTLRSLIALTTDKPDPTRLAGPLKPVLAGLLRRNPTARMKPAEAEARLRRLVDVPPTMRLRRVPRQRAAPARCSSDPIPPQGSAIETSPRTTEGETVGTNDDETTVTLVGSRSSIATDTVPPRWRVVMVAGLAAVVLPLTVVAGSGDALTVHRPFHSTGKATAVTGLPSLDTGTASPSVAQPTPSASPTAPTDFAPPARLRWWRDPTGYRIAVPNNWSRQRESRRQMVFRAPGGTAVLRVHVVHGTATDPAVRLAQAERTSHLRRYRRIRMQATSRDGDRSAVWEYRFTDREAGRLHGIDRAFVAGGRTYVIQWRTPPDRWASGQKTRTVILNSFQLIPT